MMRCFIGAICRFRHAQNRPVQFLAGISIEKVLKDDKSGRKRGNAGAGLIENREENRKQKTAKKGKLRKQENSGNRRTAETGRAETAKNEKTKQGRTENDSQQ